MYFITDINKKLIVGWSAKAGCTHIKNILSYLFQKKYPTYKFIYEEKIKKDDKLTAIHSIFDIKNLPTVIDDYRIILIVRDPYKRLVSGFIDKYSFYNNLYSYWDPSVLLTFSNFVNEIEKDDWKHIEPHHFQPQTSQAFEDRILRHTNLTIYDLENIDYSIFESIYNIKIPSDILSYRGSHIQKGEKWSKSHIVSEVVASHYNQFYIPYTYFFNKEIKEKVYHIYKKDFTLLHQYGFHYDFQVLHP